MEKINDIHVIKVGSSTITNEQGLADLSSFASIGSQLVDLSIQKKKAIIVTGGSVAAGILASASESRAERNYSDIELSRLSARGWNSVLNNWEIALGAHYGGGIQFNHDTLKKRRNRNHLLKVVHNSFESGQVVVVNENDAISHEEITFGDNDKLAARLACTMARSSLFGNDIKLVMLSDVNGVYRDVEDKSSLVSEISDHDMYISLLNTVGGSGSHHGTGGMKSKFMAADIAMRDNIDTWIANGREADVIERAISGETGTHFSANIARQRTMIAARYSFAG